jgi:MinD superfamily P-loop ATPase
MPYTIDQQYISWEVCQSHCPKGAIQQDANRRYLIEQNLCNSCLQSSLSQGILACSSNYIFGVIPNDQQHLVMLKDSNPYWEKWFATHDRLVADLQTKIQAKAQSWQEVTA